MLFGRYRPLKAMMKFSITLHPDWRSIPGAIVVPRLPEGSVFFLLAALALFVELFIQELLGAVAV